MKKPIKTLLLFLIFIFSVNSFSQETVVDKGKNRQLESMVFMRWSKRYFRPKWYYRLFHNSYRKGEDRRYVLQTAPTIVTSNLNKKSTEKEEEKVNEDYKDEISDGIDKVINAKYNTLYKGVFNELFFYLYTVDFDSDLKVLNGFSDNPFKISEHNRNVEIFMERKNAIRDSYQASHEKNTAYDNLIKDMEKYITVIKRVKRLLKVYNKYAIPLKTKPLTKN